MLDYYMIYRYSITYYILWYMVYYLYDIDIHFIIELVVVLCVNDDTLSVI